MDFDLLILPNPGNAKKVMAALEEFGFGGAGFSVGDFTESGTAIALGEQPNQIDLLTSMSSQPTVEVLRQANVAEVGGLEMKVVSFSDLLDAKKEAGRGKDWVDVEELERLNEGLNK